MVYYVVNLVMQFFSRKIFLDYLGTEILGLNTTAMNLLTFLNLAELGVAGAVGFTLYKPLHDDDRDTINDILTLQAHIYRRIGWAIVGGAVVLMAFFPLIFEKMELPLWYAYASFGVLLFSALLGYFVNYRMIILSAAQKDYVVLYSSKSIVLLKVLCQMVAVSLLPDGYVWWLVLEGLFAIIGSYTLHKATMREFPFLKNVDKSMKNLRAAYPVFVTKIKQMFFHKIAGFVLTQASPLVIYAYATLTLVALYGNYILIVNGMLLLVSSIFYSMAGGVGNLVASGNEENIRKVFRELFSLRFLITASLVFCVYALTDNFITLWVGAEYLLPQSTLFLVCLMLFIQLFRLNNDTFINAYGLFSDIWAPIIEAGLNLGLSVLLGYFFSLNGIVSGVVISLFLVVFLWKPYFLITRRMKGFGLTYIRLVCSHIILFVAVAAACLYVYRNLVIIDCSSWFGFITKTIVVGGTFMLLLLATLYITNKSMRDVVSRVLHLR